MTDKDELSQYIRERIRLAREANGLTQDDLAGAIGKTNANISDIERGRLGISATDLGLVAERLKRPISFFYPPFTADNQNTEESAEERDLLNHYRQLSSPRLRRLLTEIARTITDFVPRKGE